MLCSVTLVAIFRRWVKLWNQHSLLLAVYQNMRHSQSPPPRCWSHCSVQWTHTIRLYSDRLLTGSPAWTTYLTACVSGHGDGSSHQSQRMSSICKPRCKKADSATFPRFAVYYRAHLGTNSCVSCLHLQMMICDCV